jgi:hypothetical protein
MPRATPDESRRPVQKFRPTNGTVTGWGGLVAAALAAVLAAVTEPNLLGLRVVLGAALGGVLVWVVLLRPRAAAYRDTLVLRNQLSDLHLPLVRVEAVAVRHALNVWVGEQRYVCSGIGRSTRSMMKTRGRGPMAVLGLEQTDDRMGLGQIGEIGSSGEYAAFVEERIVDLARSARRDLQDTDPPPVRRVWAVRELSALAVLGVAFALSLLL